MKSGTSSAATIDRMAATHTTSSSTMSTTGRPAPPGIALPPGIPLLSAVGLTW